jgi:phage tail sheath protein FI
MATPFMYPGVYIQEIPSGVRTITGVATSITAFIGRALRGPVNEPMRVQSIADFERVFGGLWRKSTLSYAIQHYFLNGGREALITRIVHSGDEEPGSNAAKATTPDGGVGGLMLEAANEGGWGNRIKVSVDKVSVDNESVDESDPGLFNLTVQELASVALEGEVITEERFLNVSTDPLSPRYVGGLLEDRSAFARLMGDAPENGPIKDETMLVGGSDGVDLDASDYEGSSAAKTGLHAFDKADLFNLMCIPPFACNTGVDQSTWVKALAYCKTRRAMLIVDPPSEIGPGDFEGDNRYAAAMVAGLRDENAVLYFPWVKMADPLQENRLEEFAPCGVVAGVFARTDADRGVWKAPAGLDARLVGVRQLTYKMTDGENGQINPLGVNALRTFPAVGHVIWGARTLEGADRLASEWKYIPVRRLALFIEESLFRGTQWVVFEPNDEPLWAQIRLNVGAFMQDLFRQGAFQGTTARAAYFVKCDAETTTQNDVDRGIVNILVGFAPLKPAEFVVIKIQQMAGQVET